MDVLPMVCVLGFIEGFVVLCVVTLLILVVIGPILAGRALSRVNRLADRLRRIEREQLRALGESIKELVARVGRLEFALRGREAPPAESTPPVEKKAEKPAEAAATPAPAPPPSAPPKTPATTRPSAIPVIPPPVPGAKAPVRPPETAKPPEVVKPPVAPAPVPHATRVRPPAPSRTGKDRLRDLQKVVGKITRSEETAPDGSAGISWARFEEALGKRWLTWVGVVIVFLSAGFFLRYAFKQRWINPTRQILSAVFWGLVMIGGGIHFLRKEMRVFGQGLVGGGLMVLYIALFCAYSPHVYDEPVIGSQKLVFALMCVVTLIGMALAVWRDAQPILFLAVLGGFVTPIMASTGANSRDALFAYLLLLDLGVLGVALWKRWRALDVLAFAGTVVLFVGWFLKFYVGEAAYAADARVPTLLWLGAFYTVFLALPFVHHLRARTVITVERFIMALANATFAFVIAWVVLRESNPHALAFISLGMAAVYCAFGVLTQKRIAEDKRALLSFLALAMMFLTISVPLYFELNGITLAWAAEACVLLYLGYRWNHRIVRYGAFVVLLLAVRRTISVHWDALAHEEMFTLIFNREFMILLTAPAAAAVSAFIHYLFRRDAGGPDVVMKRICTIGAGFLTLAFLNTELQQWLTLRAGGWGLDPDYLNGCALTLLWSMGAAGFLAGGWSGRANVFRWFGLVPLAVALGHVVSLYTIDVNQDYWLFINGRFPAVLMTVAVIGGYARSFRDPKWRLNLLGATGWLLLLLVHVESWLWISEMARHWTHSAGYIAGRTLGLIWVAGAVGYLATGRLLRKDDLGRLALLPLLIALGFTVHLYTRNDDTPFLLILNTRFLLGALTAACIVVWTRLADEPKVKRFAMLASGYLALVLLHVEGWSWIRMAAGGWEVSAAYVANRALGLLWALGAMTYFCTGAKRREGDISRLGIAPLAMAIAFAGYLYLTPSRTPFFVLVNTRFLLGLLVLAGIASVVRLIDDEKRALVGNIITGYVGLLLLFGEFGHWLWARSPEHGSFAFDWVRIGMFIWTPGAIAYLASGRWRRMRELYWAALVPLTVSAVCVFSVYGWLLPAGRMLYINWHFLGGVLTAATLIACVLRLRKHDDEMPPGERSARTFFYWCGVTFLLYVLSAESTTWCHMNYKGYRSASWMAGMSLTLTWGVYAAGMLVTGFWRRRRGLRLTALALFAVTAVKLIVVDIIWVQEIYRIIAFFVLGMLMLGAAYLYHKAERLLADVEKKDG